MQWHFKTIRQGVTYFHQGVCFIVAARESHRLCLIIIARNSSNADLYWKYVFAKIKLQDKSTKRKMCQNLHKL